jgi:hypothetical protein
VLVDQLERVAVAGDDHHVKALVFRLRRQRGDHVVGFVALDTHVAVAEGLHQRVERRPLLAQQVGARAALGLVLGIDLLAAGPAGVPDHQGRHRSVLGQQLHEHRGEAEDRIRRLTLRGRDRVGQRKESPVDERVPVDQE